MAKYIIKAVQRRVAAVWVNTGEAGDADWDWLKDKHGKEYAEIKDIIADRDFFLGGSDLAYTDAINAPFGHIEFCFSALCNVGLRALTKEEKNEWEKGAGEAYAVKVYVTAEHIETIAIDEY